MYSEYSLAPNAPEIAIREIPQNSFNIRQGLNGPAIAVPNVVQMAQPPTHHPQHAAIPNHNPQPHKSHKDRDRERINVLAIPSSTIVDGQLDIGDATSMSERSYTPVKGVGNGSFGTVWLCDWHTPLPPSFSLPDMQQGPGAKPEWQGKRLVAIKCMKKRWEGGWDECRKHPELESLRNIPPHENVIPLYDCFLLPSSKELYFVFECMEGNLYQLIKSRKGRPLAGGLVASIFHQTCKGLAHIHDSGYFHRDMKPENLLVTTTGLTDYASVSPLAPPGAPPEKDVVVVIKLADFGLARLIKSKPPYTEYVSTRWYRAPEVLLQSTDYSAPVDLWALGTIMAEVVNLKPLFPGNNGQDQLQRICQVLGDPSDVYGFDSHGRPRGGGKWSRGLKMAKQTGILFEKAHPMDFWSLFEPSTPYSLIDCIHSLLRYDPEVRLTAHGCLEHVYFIETSPRSAYPPPLSASRRHVSSAGSGTSSSSRNGPLGAVSPREIPPSHSHSARHRHQHSHHHHHHPYPNGLTNSHRHPFVPTQAHLVSGDKDMTPADGIVEVDRSNNPIRRYPSHHRQNTHPDRMVIDPPLQEQQHPAGKSGMFGLKKLGSMFAHQDKPPTTLLPVEETMTFAPRDGATRSTPSLRDTPSTSSDSRSLPEPNILFSNQSIPPPVPLPPPVPPPPDAKKLKKEQKRLEQEAEKERRAIQERRYRERSQAVMVKHRQIVTPSMTAFEFQSTNSARLANNTARKPKVTKEDSSALGNGVTVPPGVVAANPYGSNHGSQKGVATGARQRGLQAANSGVPLAAGAYEYRNKRRKDEDEQSMSSSDVQSVGKMSVISFATMDSDPGPNRPLRRRPSVFNGHGLSPRPVGTATSISSLQSYTNSPRSSHSVEPGVRSNNSIDAQFVNDFEARTTFAAPSGNLLYSPGIQPPSVHVTHGSHSGGVDTMSPPSMQSLTLAGSPNHPSWTLESANGDQGSTDGNSMTTLGSRRMPHDMGYHSMSPGPGHHLNNSREHFGQSRSHPPTPHSVNPAFQVIPPVPPLPATSHSTAGTSLPSFSTLMSSMGDIQDIQRPIELPPQPQDHPP